MNYDLYYFIPWPESERYAEVDENSEYVYDVGVGAFVDKEWADKLNA